MSIKKFAIWLTYNPPENQLSNHSGFEIGSTDWRAYHVHDESVWESFVEEGYPNLSESLKVYTTETDEDGYEYTVFDAEATVAALIAAMQYVTDGTAEFTGFVIVSIGELKDMLASEAYEEAYGSTDEESA